MISLSRQILSPVQPTANNVPEAAPVAVVDPDIAADTAASVAAGPNNEGWDAYVKGGAETGNPEQAKDIQLGHEALQGAGLGNEAPTIDAPKAADAVAEQASQQ